MTRLLLAGVFAFTATAALADKSPPPAPVTEQDLQLVIIDDTAGDGSDSILVPVIALMLFVAAFN